MTWRGRRLLHHPCQDVSGRWSPGGVVGRCDSHDERVDAFRHAPAGQAQRRLSDLDRSESGRRAVDLCTDAVVVCTGAVAWIVTRFEGGTCLEVLVHYLGQDARDEDQHGQQCGECRFRCTGSTAHGVPNATDGVGEGQCLPLQSGSRDDWGGTLPSAAATPLPTHHEHP